MPNEINKKVYSIPEGAAAVSEEYLKFSLSIMDTEAKANFEADIFLKNVKLHLETLFNTALKTQDFCYDPLFNNISVLRRFMFESGVSFSRRWLYFNNPFTEIKICIKVPYTANTYAEFEI